MAIKSIEIICIPCKKCADLEIRIHEIIKCVEMINKIKIPFEFKHITDIRNISKYNLNPSQTPAVLFNGKVEFAGHIDLILVRRKLESLHREDGATF